MRRADRRRNSAGALCALSEMVDEASFGATNQPPLLAMKEKELTRRL
jgi:hypothetical protein